MERNDEHLLLSFSLPLHCIQELYRLKIVLTRLLPGSVETFWFVLLDCILIPGFVNLRLSFSVFPRNIKTAISGSIACATCNIGYASAP